jgi:hypothetical protein
MLLGAAALALSLVAGNTTQAASKKVARSLEATAFDEYGEFNGPAYILVSISSPVFETPFIQQLNGKVINQADEMGSTMALVRTGTVIGNATIEESRFEGDNLINVDLEGASINGHSITFIGGFRTSSDGVFHVLTPSPEFANPIPQDVQEAYFYASRKFLDPDFGLPTFPTTVELAAFIVQFGGADGGEADVDINVVAQSLFVGDMTAVCASPCTFEGDLFGHEPSEDQFFFRGLIDDDNDTLRVDIGRNINFEIKPGSPHNPINLGSNGVEPIGIFTEKQGGNVVFDAPGEIDLTTIRVVVFDEFGFELASLPVDKTDVEDLDGDGCDDLIVHIRTQKLVEFIDFETTVTIHFRANTKAEGMEVAGVDSVVVVPN